MVNKISNKTLIPLSSIGVIITIMIWVMSLYSKVEYNEDKIKALDDNNKVVNSKLDDISQRLSKIEGFLIHMSKQLRGGNIND